MAGKRIDHAALTANYQNPGDIYQDTNTEAAFGVIEQQVNDNWDDYDAHKKAATLDHPDGSVTTNKLSDLSVTTGKLADSSVTSAKIADGTIVTGDIADSAITTAKIADLNVTTAKLNNLAVTTGKIADAAVTSAKIADGTIVDADINAAAAISWVKVSKVASSLADLATRSAGDLNSGTLPAARLPTGINAAILADGSVSNAELQYINSLTSNAQTQIDGKAPSTHVGSNGIAQHALVDATNAGFMSVADKTKIDSVQSGAEVNQNAFSKISVSGQADVDADSKTDTVTLAGGTGITLTTDPVTDTVTITATGTSTPGPHASSHIPGGTDIIPNATVTTSGLHSAADKQKLDEIGASSVAPLMDGAVAVGTSLHYSREDHIHPTDTTRLAATAGSATDTIIGNRTIDDTVAAAVGADTPTRLWSKLANMIKAITGKANWYTPPVTSIEALKTTADAALPKAGGTMTGQLIAKPTIGGMNDPAGGKAGFEVRGGGAVGDAAFQAFHRPGAFAAYFGLDTDNKWKVGGWSMGANLYELWTAQNLRDNAGVLELFTGGVWKPVGGKFDKTAMTPLSESIADIGLTITYATILNITGKGYLDFAVLKTTGLQNGWVKITVDGVVKVENIGGAKSCGFASRQSLMTSATTAGKFGLPISGVITEINDSSIKDYNVDGAVGGSNTFCLNSDSIYFNSSLKIEVKCSSGTDTGSYSYSGGYQ